jgi:hypothetical protein
MDAGIAVKASTTLAVDEERAVGVIVLAFTADPVARWVFPDPHEYLTHFPTGVRAFGGRAFAHGYGSVLLRYALSQCDRDHVAAYLESSNPASIPLYQHQRHGFGILDTIEVGSSPPIFPMLRHAR